MEKAKVCAYCRVSTKDKEQLTSFENQMTFFQREFGGNDNYELVKLYADCGRSGTSLIRPDFDKMIADAGIDKSQMDKDLFCITSKPTFNRILVKNTSRFARNVSADMLLKTLRKNGVYVDFIDTHLSTERDADIMVVQMLQVLDENDSRDKSRKVMFGLQESIKRGNILAHGNMYGYKYYPRPENRLEAIENEAKVIRLIFTLYADKRMGAKRICDYLSKQGIRTRKGNQFNENTVLGMIKNEAYTGRGVRQKYSAGLIFEKHSMRETGNAVVFDTDKIEPIIDRELFEKAQAVLDSKVIRHVLKGRNDGKTDFAGKVVCGCCGTKYFCSGTRVTQKAGGKTRIYSCRKKLTKHYDDKGKRVMLCDNPNVTEQELNGFLNTYAYTGLIWIRLKSSITQLQEIRQALESRIDRQNAEDVTTLQGRLAEIAKQKDKLLDLYMSDMFSKAQLDERATPLNAEENELNATIKVLSKPNDEIHQDIAEVDETLKYLKEQDKLIFERMNKKSAFVQLTREEMLAGLERIVVEPDGHLTPELKAYEEMDRLLAKHRHLMNDQLIRKNAS